MGELTDCLLLHAECHWDDKDDSYYQNFWNYSTLIEGDAAQDMVTVSNMAALGVEVQGACIRQAKTMRIVVPTWHVQPSTPTLCF